MTQIAQYSLFRKRLLVGTIHLVTSVINAVFYGRKSKVGVGCEEKLIEESGLQHIYVYLLSTSKLPKKWYD